MFHSHSGEVEGDVGPALCRRRLEDAHSASSERTCGVRRRKRPVGPGLVSDLLAARSTLVNGCFAEAGVVAHQPIPTLRDEMIWRHGMVLKADASNQAQTRDEETMFLLDKKGRKKQDCATVKSEGETPKLLCRPGCTCRLGKDPNMQKGSRINHRSPAGDLAFPRLASPFSLRKGELIVWKLFEILDNFEALDFRVRRKQTGPHSCILCPPCAFEKLWLSVSNGPTSSPTSISQFGISSLNGPLHCRVTN